MAIRNKIIIKSRLKVLQRTIKDLFEGTYSYHNDKFSAPYERILETIEKGIEKEYIEEISVLGLNNQEIINRLSFNIDWNKHKVFCKSSTETYEFVKDNSIAEQISKTLPVLSSFISNAIIRENVNNLEVYFSYRSGINIEVARKELGLIDSSNDEIKRLDRFEKETVAVEVCPKKLSELSIKFDCRK